jgi:hypothetical protein
MTTKKTKTSTMTAWGWKPHWAQSRTSKAWSGSRNSLNARRQDAGLQNVPTRKRKDDWKRLVLQQMQALRKPNPIAVTVTKNKMPYITQDVEAAYYCVPIIEDR